MLTDPVRGTEGSIGAGMNRRHFTFDWLSLAQIPANLTLIGFSPGSVIDDFGYPRPNATNAGTGTRLDGSGMEG